MCTVVPQMETMVLPSGDTAKARGLVDEDSISSLKRVLIVARFVTRRVPSREAVTRCESGVKAMCVTASMWPGTRPVRVPVRTSHTPTRWRGSAAAMDRPSGDQAMGEKTSLSSRRGLEEEKSRMMSVAERVAMRGRAEEDEGVDDLDVLKRRRDGEDGEEWAVGEKAATQPMILE